MQRWSRASYWIYLIHHPLVAACHLELSRTDWAAEVQFLLAATLTIGLSWASYCLFVEQSAVGEFLDGRQQVVTTTKTATVVKRAA